MCRARESLAETVAAGTHWRVEGEEDDDDDDEEEEDDEENNDVDNAGARDDRWMAAGGVAEPIPRDRHHRHHHHRHSSNHHKERISRGLVPQGQQQQQQQPKEPTSCELCGDVFRTPVSYHMLTAHPGCGNSSGGRGYTSNGTYKTGWSGACGEGGIAWYLLCEACRGNYMRRSAGGAAATAGPSPVRLRKTGAVARHADNDAASRRKPPHRGEYPSDQDDVARPRNTIEL